MSKDEKDIQVIPDIIFDSHNRIQYKKGRFFGKVSFSYIFYLVFGAWHHRSKIDFKVHKLDVNRRKDHFICEPDIVHSIRILLIFSLTKCIVCSTQYC